MKQIDEGISVVNFLSTTFNEIDAPDTQTQSGLKAIFRYINNHLQQSGNKSRKGDTENYKIFSFCNQLMK